MTTYVTKELVARLSWKKLQEYLKGHPHLRLPTLDEVELITTNHREVWFNGRQIMNDGYGDKMGVYDCKNKIVGYANPSFKMNVVLIKDTNGTK